MEECPICLEALKFNRRKVHVTDCNHSFHEMCFKKLKTRTCPCCRTVIEQNINSLIKNLKLELKELEKDFRNDKKMAASMINDAKKKPMLMKVLEKMEKKILQDGRYFVLEIQKNKILNLEDDIQIQMVKVESLIEVASPRLFEYYRVKILEKNNMLGEANTKKLLGRA